MRILVPTADYPPIEGGISTVALNVTRELAAMGHEVTVVAPRFPGQEAFDAAEPVRVVRFGGYGLGWLRFLPMLAATWPHVKRSDLILGINIAYGGVMGYLARRSRGVPYVTFAYAYEFLKFGRNSLPGRLLLATYGGATSIIAISHYTRGQLVAFGVPGERISVVLPGAPAPAPCSDTALQALRARYALGNDRVILAVGRFIARKGHATLVRAMPGILARFPDTVLVLVGRGPYMGDAIRTAAELGVRDRVVFPGHVPDEDVAGLYQLCDVFALPTGQDANGQVEGFGLVFSEAHAYGKPVVAGRSGGVVDAVVDGETGLLVEPDSPGALADAVNSLLGDPDLARRLGDNGRRRVESELNWTRFTERMLDAVGAAS
ncbi:MAG: glycosyltransferase [Nitrospiraceae bacterium]|nr:glycosyltransferase [Nitrospiraceae bacterium]